MFFMKKKKEYKEPELTEEYLEFHEWLVDFAKVGRRFKYLGQDFIIVHAYINKEAGESTTTGSDISADYVGNDGIIRSEWFSYPRLYVLREIEK